MRLELTVVAAPGCTIAEPVELSIDAPRGCSGTVIENGLARRWPETDFSLNTRPLAVLTVGTPPLTSGAVVVAGSMGTPVERKCPTLVLAVLAGPDSGAVFALSRGRYRIGRGRVEISIRDPEMSRIHAALEVGEHLISLRCPVGAIGFWVDGMRSRGGAITVGQTISFGATRVRLVFVPDPEEPAPHDGEPQVALPVRRPQQRPGRSWALAVTGGVPLLLGTGLALGTGQWMFMAFASMSAMSVWLPLLAGRRRKAFRSELTSAVQADCLRRLAGYPSAADLVLRLGLLTAHQKDDDGTGRRGGAGVRTGSLARLRVGTATLPANLAAVPADENFSPPLVSGMPVLVALEEPREAGPNGGLAISGARESVNGLLRYLLMQLDAAGVRTVVFGPVGTLPLAARFLPNVVLTANPATVAVQLSLSGPTAVVQTAVPVPAAARGAVDGVPQAVSAVHRYQSLEPLLESAAQWPGADSWVPAGEPPMGSRIRLTASDDGVQGLLDGERFVPDLVSAVTFERFARQRGTACSSHPGAAADGIQGIPAAFSLPGLPTPEEVLGIWGQHCAAALEPIVIGAADGGPLLLDLERDGPHLLVAGTTGSGKSELLRTLVASLAATHPPSALQLLFLDFKGGSGLGPLVELPHCAGLVTDISGHGLHRVLTSLRAESRRRESLFSQEGAEDIRCYAATAPPGGQSRARPPVPQLVIVVDEFRMLVEQAPDALPELMRLAATGRSLGIHLVLATQRPQGAISADIRANVTTNICLRVQSGYESLDVLGTPAAAGIPLASPGRAYISRGGELPVEFQAAVLWTAQTRVADPVIRSARHAVQEAPLAKRGTASAGPAREWSRILGSAQILSGKNLPPAALAPELPQVLACRDLADLAPGELSLGLLDVPELQCVLPLTWAPRRQSHLAMIGPTPGARTDLCRLLVDQLQQHHNLFSWLYCLDGDGSLASLAVHADVGAYLEPVDLRSAARLFQLFADLPNEPEDGTDLLVLVITGWGRWLSAIRSSPWPWCEDLLADVVRDGRKSAAVLMISGERELMTARFIAGIPNRIFFPLGASAESMLSWPRLPLVPRYPGRVLVAGTIADDAAGTGGTLDAGTAGTLDAGIHPAQLALHDPDRGTRTAAARQGKPPFTVRALPSELTVSEVSARAHAISASRPSDCPDGSDDRTFNSTEILLGLGGDNHDPVYLRLDSGSVLLAMGPPRSGKTTLLETLVELNPGHFDWLRLGIELDSGSTGTLSCQTLVERSAANGRILVLLIDDADGLHAEVQDVALRLHVAGAAVIAAVDSRSPGAGRFQLASAARNCGTGLVLSPRRPADGDFFNCRLDTDGHLPAGRAVLIDHGSPTWLQLPRRSAGRHPATLPTPAGT
ncbi:FtsK/SpoIIIE domain-containing protein [Arthrobacter sp. H14-L1]|uniref:FtsK/SpoIIIE domain-containing protein n=1 Tax=Arthrobacter sp. H14-L1 TaxID=2996697 RepID=UPI00226D5080|nr:FtsK/SpoIIIE domain-containing protein [Arthrobacter sp. H14-L1]MCY0903564.1 FtsK/SpoIIIE domain-containing protein [Arthrobacter sp. H14-L1]